VQTFFFVVIKSAQIWGSGLGCLNHPSFKFGAGNIGI